MTSVSYRYSFSTKTKLKLVVIPKAQNLTRTFIVASVKNARMRSTNNYVFFFSNDFLV